MIHKAPRSWPEVDRLKLGGFVNWNGRASSRV
jgi:hypothetical protein